MFEQHPVPQNISSYQFHLVGDMTLKQFLELAAGVVVGIILYSTGLPGIIKWPLIGISVIFGAALAFVPLEERPLEQWVVAFFRSVYSPTLFHWEKNSATKYFTDETGPTEANAIAPANLTAPKLDTAESSYLSRLGQIFSPTTTVQNMVQQQPQTQGASTAATIPTPTHVQPLSGVLAMNSQPATPNPVAGAKDIQIPQTTFVSMDKSQRPQMVVEETNSGIVSPSTPISTQPVGQVLTGQNIAQAIDAQFSTDAAPPSLPTIVNTISGQVMTSDGKIIEGAVLEILDSEGRSVRALRTNKAGHFLNVTPLMDGKYKLTIEKEGFSFEPIEFTAANNIIQPIAIHAK